MKKLKVGCARPLGASVGGKDLSEPAIPKGDQEVKKMVMVGKKAPDFVAPAYYRGEFITVRLSDYLGKWVMLCFYPGDFTFV